MTRVLGLLGLVLVAAGEARAATRVALIVGAGGVSVRTAIDLATVKVSAVPGVQLLERAGIERVLAEQKLSLAGLADAGQAIKAGKLLSADILAVVEVTPDGKAALGLVVFDAKTGLRLWDAALPAGGPEKEADGINEGIRAALKKHAAGVAGLRTVGIMAVRNADLPRPMDSFCDSLALLVERRLAAAPNVGVLERQRLEAVTGERALPTQAAEKELLGALVQLDLEVRRGPQGEGLRATALLTDGKGRKLRKSTVLIKESEPSSGAEALARDICAALQTAPAEGHSDPTREGGRFLMEAKQLWSFKQYPRALRAAEAAHALDPTDPAKHVLLAEYLIARGGDLLAPARPFLLRRITADAAVVAEAAGLVRRGLDLRTLVLNNLLSKDRSAFLTQMATDRKVDNELTICLMKFIALDGSRQTPEAKRQAADLLATVESWLCDQYLETMAKSAQGHSGMFIMYTTALKPRVDQLRLAAPDAQHFTRKLVALSERWLDVSAQQKLAQPAILLPWAMFTLTTEMARHPIRWSPGPREWELIDGLFTTMEKHPLALTRFQGRCGRLWVGLANKTLTPEECYKRYLSAKRVVRAYLEDPRVPVDEMVWVTYVNLMLDLLSGNMLGFKESGHHADEVFELSERMLSRNILVARFLYETILSPLDPTPDTARKLAMLDRTLTALDSPRVAFYGVERPTIKNVLATYREKFLQENPKLAGVRRPSTLETSRVVLDVADLPGIREILLPTFAGDELYVTGIGAERGRDYLQPFRVSLTGKIAQPLGKVFITLRRAPRTAFASVVPQKITGCQVGVKHLYIATRTEGLYAFPLAGGPGQRIDTREKLPAEGVESLVLFEGRLYAALEGGYLVSVDPESGRFEVLASCRRREKASPFDDSETFSIPFLDSDPERHRLVFLLTQGRTRPNSLNGLWTWDPKNKDFKRLLETTGAEWPMEGRRNGDRLFLAGTTKALDFDLAHDKHTLVYAWGDPNGTVLSEKTALCRQGFPGNPAVYRDGWMWTTSPLSRVSIAERKQEVLSPPQRKGNASIGGDPVLIQVGKDRLVFATTTALWLLEPRKK